MNNDIQAGLEAFRAGRKEDAFAYLKAAFDAGHLRDDAILALAQSALALGHIETAIAVIDGFLERFPTNADALLIKADAFKAQGKARIAIGFYQAFLRALQNNGAVPPHLREHAIRAQHECQNANKLYQDHLVARFDEAGFSITSEHSRIGQAIDIMLGKKTIYFQEPSKFFFPELPQTQFYDPAGFDWAAAITEQAGVIRDELASLIASNAEFDPYVQHNVNVPKMSRMGIDMLGGTDWSAFHLFQDGEECVEHTALCPKTIEILRMAPIPEISTVSPSILFSRLSAQASIPPHSGVCNARLICHLPLIVPPGGWLRVGNQRREWKEGEMLIFDDTIEHEAKNPSSDFRIVLIFDVWRPELSAEERTLVETVFNAVASF